ncbi:hypothetical protein E2C01_051827 [Portunus trituberculatus]|uniref:Uncharacterized protein n=1 Tax=Portunus trituberculatus TaxID=210409 RepID=A0A5B7GJU7_PORTR|nr:hypothetical protein [Portunus trituberculatus]
MDELQTTGQHARARLTPLGLWLILVRSTVVTSYFVAVKEVQVSCPFLARISCDDASSQPNEYTHVHAHAYEHDIHRNNKTDVNGQLLSLPIPHNSYNMAARATRQGVGVGAGGGFVGGRGGGAAGVVGDEENSAFA